MDTTEDKSNPINMDIVEDELSPINMDTTDCDPNPILGNILNLKCPTEEPTFSTKKIKSYKHGVHRKTPLNFAGLNNLFFFVNMGKDFPIKCAVCKNTISKEKMSSYLTVRCSNRGCRKYLAITYFKAYLYYLYFRGIVSVITDDNGDDIIQFKNLKTNKIEKKYKFYKKDGGKDVKDNSPLFPPLHNDKCLGDLMTTWKCIYDIPGYGNIIKNENKITVNDLLYEKIVYKALSPSGNKKRKLNYDDEEDDSAEEFNNNSNNNSDLSDLSDPISYNFLSPSVIAILKRKKLIREIFNSNTNEVKEIKEAIVRALEKHRAELPPTLKNILNDENALKRLQEAFIGLTTKSKKYLRPNDLTCIYVKGLERQPISTAKEFLIRHGLKKKWIKNVSFINRDICEITSFKNKEDEIKKIFRILSIKINKDGQIREDFSYKILEDFNPAKGFNNPSPTKEELCRIERGYYKRIQDTISRKGLPSYLKEYFSEKLEKAKTSFSAYVPPEYQNKEIKDEQKKVNNDVQIINEDLEIIDVQIEKNSDIEIIDENINNSFDINLPKQKKKNKGKKTKNRNPGHDVDKKSTTTNNHSMSTRSKNSTTTIASSTVSYKGYESNDDSSGDFFI